MIKNQIPDNMRSFILASLFLFCSFLKAQNNSSLVLVKANEVEIESVSRGLLTPKQDPQSAVFSPFMSVYVKLYISLKPTRNL